MTSMTRSFGAVVLGCLVAMGSLVVLPAAALAQDPAGSLTGEVADETGAVLPGVTIEAASPVLIEGSRIAVSDGQGRYTIVDLRPGTYSLSFVLPGFSTLVREGIALTSGFTATVDAQLQVGGSRRR